MIRFDPPPFPSWVDRAKKYRSGALLPPIRRRRRQHGRGTGHPDREKVQQLTVGEQDVGAGSEHDGMAGDVAGCGKL